MPTFLMDIENWPPETLRLDHIHYAITNEARDSKNWDNALKLFTHYLAPLVVAAQKATAAAASANPTAYNSTTTRNKGAGMASWVKDFKPDSSGSCTKPLSQEDIKLVQWSIAVLVRYAPSPTESNMIYMFFLKCEPPVRSDETIDTCLISLIYKYAQVRGNRELQVKGLDLILVALERGVGLPTYAPIKRNMEMEQNEPILASVSRPILSFVKQHISTDGRKLLPGAPPPTKFQLQCQRSNQRFNQQQLQRPNQQQYQQQPVRAQRNVHQGPQQGQQHGPQHGPQQQPQQYRPMPQNQQSPQQNHQSPQPKRSGIQGRSHMRSPDPKHVEISGTEQGQDGGDRAESPPQPLQQNKQQGPQESSSPSLPKKKSKDKEVKKRGSPTPPRTSNRYHTSGLANEEDQYAYYEQASRRSFAGAGYVGRVGRQGTGGHGIGSGGQRTIAFVPASTNANLNPSNQQSAGVDQEVKESISAQNVEEPLAAEEKQQPEDHANASVELAAGIEKMVLASQSDE